MAVCLNNLCNIQYMIYLFYSLLTIIFLIIYFQKQFPGLQVKYCVNKWRVLYLLS